MAKISKLISLKGRTALVTGAAGHIGQAFCETLAELGAELLLVDRPGSDLNNLAEGLRRRWNSIALGLPCDLELESDRAALIASVLARDSGMSVLVNNAAFVGTSELKGWATDFPQQSLETWRRAFEVNLTAAFDLTKSFFPLLKRGPKASVINIGSIYGVYAPDYGLYEGTEMGNPAAYAASKGGLLQLTRWLAASMAPDVRVNALSPGGVFRQQPDVFVRRYEARTPLKRMARDDDMCGALAYLASDLSGYVTGQNLVVDGGWGL